jgi:glycosyltransferase involved in cell wall biosynthesis
MTKPNCAAINNRAPALYLSYTGLLEPLGQSQILAYLERLSDNFQFTLVTFEKADDLENKIAINAMRQHCETFGINWLPKRYHHRPRLVGTTFDLAILAYSTWKYSRAGKAKLVHCRSYIPAISAWLVGKFTGTPFLFDMRALWLEEMIDAGRLERNSMLHKALVWIEKRLLHDAGHIVSLTNNAVDYLLEEHALLQAEDFTVITTCVDLKRFDQLPPPPQDRYLGTMGTVTSGWFHLDWCLRLMKLEKANNPISVFPVITRDPEEKIHACAVSEGLEPDSLVISSCSPIDVPSAIVGMKAGIIFYTASIGDKGRSPTRLGEFLAAGVPVIANRGVGDMAEIVENNRVGVIAEGGEPHQLRTALDSLHELLEDPSLSRRCTNVAKEHFSADHGSDLYDTCYQKSIGRTDN